MPGALATIEDRLLADPDDTAAWEAHAASLRAQEDPRAYLLTHERRADTPTRQALLAELLAPYRASWTPAGLHPDACEWRHGFVVGATLRIAGRGDARRLAPLLADPRARFLGRLRLVIDPAAPARSLVSLAAAQLGRLRVLRASYHARGHRIVRALERQPALNLRTLDLRHSGLHDDSVRALTGCAPLPELRCLYLQHNRIGAGGVAALARWPALAGVTLLDLRDNPIGAAGAAALAESPYLGALTTLHLHADQPGPDGVRALASSTTLPRDLVRFWRAQEAPR